VNYKERLIESSYKTGNCTCMGLDFQKAMLPYQKGNFSENVKQFCEKLFNSMIQQNLIPSAFKPNIGYYVVEDRPRENSFDGSVALATVLDLLEQYFPNIPVILDSKRGDIARSSLNYAQEAFEVWKADAVTVAPYMGDDSVEPFNFDDKGIYVLNRTSNPGAKTFQNLSLDNEPLYMQVSKRIVKWQSIVKGIGAVVGATSSDELREISSFYSEFEVSLLIPGVGSQGASAKETLNILKESNYNLSLVRINSSSGLTHPWGNKGVPSSWLEDCLDSLKSLLEETSI
jgi:orotidine-5'-phosphate decarboxylase